VIAFFDVDGTLTVAPSMFRFLRYLLAQAGEPPSAYAAAVAEARSLASGGASRDAVLLACYRHYAGRAVDEVAAAAEDWFAWEQCAGDFFLAQPSRAYAAHRLRGDLTAIVSGSFAACLSPIARHLGADGVLCSVLEEMGGIFTGQVAASMTGPAKAAAVRAFAASRRVDLAECHAYGDDASDLPMMVATGGATVVGLDPALGSAAATRGWSRLPGVMPPESSAPPDQEGDRDG